MVELLLNTLWLLVALAAAGYSWSRWSRAEGEAQRHAVCFRWVALACGLILLFFVISLTDDLHSELTTLEDSSISKRALAGWVKQHGGSSGKLVVHHPSVILPDSPSLANAQTCGKIIPSGILPPRQVSLCPTPGRAPPSLSL